ncbi:MAG: HAD family phosphatase [Oligoflexia bacterium]|nr:HAD family phosphatase [Oligoflexia bacterium]
MKLPEGAFDAYLFDCDGTLAHSMPIHYQAWKEVLAPWNCEFPETLFYEWAGRPTEAIIHSLNEIHQLKMPFKAIDQERDRLYFEYLPKVQPVAEVIEHVHDGFGRIPMAVVSGSPRASVIKTLTYLGIEDRFGAIVGAEDYSKGKPHPEPFLTAAKRLGVAPNRCLVFEDAQLGIQSAIAANMSWVKVPSY